MLLFLNIFHALHSILLPLSTIGYAYFPLNYLISHSDFYNFIRLIFWTEVFIPDISQPKFYFAVLELSGEVRLRRGRKSLFFFFFFNLGSFMISYLHVNSGNVKYCCGMPCLCSSIQNAMDCTQTDRLSEQIWIYV